MNYHFKNTPLAEVLKIVISGEEGYELFLTYNNTMTHGIRPCSMSMMEDEL